MLIRKLSLAVLFLVGGVLTGVQACDEAVSDAVPNRSQPVAVSNANDVSVENAMPTSYDRSAQIVAPADNTNYVGFDQLITEYQNQPASNRLDNADKATIGKPSVQYRVDREMQHGY